MFASIPSAIVVGVDGHPVTVEVHVGKGLPGLSIVGLPDAACREARDRVRAAVLAAEATWPAARITINLAPSDTRKAGSGLDLAMAVGVLVASGQLETPRVHDLAFVGELGLDGTVRPVPGIVCRVDAVQAGTVVVPLACAADAALVEGPAVRPVTTLAEVLTALRTEPAEWPDHPIPAVAGRLAGLLPDLTRDRAMEATRVHSAAGAMVGGLVTRPPYRAPHHTATMVALVGGGTDALRPGEVSMAHAGVLFLDELGEFAPAVLDALRQPLEEGVIRVSRARFSADLPARVLLVAAMNPCPCGEGGRPGACRCPDGLLARYRRRLLGGDLGPSAASVAERVAAARELAARRGVACNALLEGAQLDDAAPLNDEATQSLATALGTGKLSARGLTKVRRVALTVADLAGHRGPLTAFHINTAMAMRIDVVGTRGLAA